MKKIDKTIKHELYHACVSSWLGYDVFEKSFTFKNLQKYFKKSDMNSVITYVSMLTEEEFEAHKTIIKMIIKGYKDEIKVATALLKKHKILHYSDWQAILKECSYD